MSTHPSCVIALIALTSILPITEARSVSAPPYDIDGIDRCVRSNGDSRSMRQSLELDIFDRADSKRSLEVTVLRKRFETGLSRVIMRVVSPFDMRNTAFLIIEQHDRPNDVFSYMPSMDRVRRISMRAAAGSVFGSDFSYEDMQRLQAIAEDGERRLLPDREIDGRTAFVVESIRRDDEHTTYERVVTYIDKERCGLLQAEMFDKGDVLRKLLTIDPDSVVRIGDRWVAKRVSIEDRRQRTRSVMTIHDIELDIEIADSAFSESALSRGH